MEDKSKKDWRVPSLAIICITVLEALAIYKGVDGYLMSLAFAAIAGLGGYTLRKVVGGKHG